MLINLWVKDNLNSEIHQVGTDPHDSIVFLSGQVTYYNLQNGSGTLGGDYEWVDPPDLDNYVSVTQEELWINRKLLHEDVLKKIEERSKSGSVKE